MLKKLMAKLQNEEGQGLVEYALIIVLIAIVLVGALTYVEGGINAAFVKIGDILNP